MKYLLENSRELFLKISRKSDKQLSEISKATLSEEFSREMVISKKNQSESENDSINQLKKNKACG